ncbi:peptide ABC transporter ATP-binding protein [Actinobacillus delphinicola]|uniref:oligopeptide/dipeptide ABC transporter ATP-binding protein n=1 Tax=Actinobacillus delphinicola TaxID=51161 RepID=UPI002442D3CA|nr:oligopeptide/dipeptide ABC transporter ATP-binding protein [Actinobacillus delphinicola]MDG6897383.1 peptide ABC transporter ATP-binding protein [Actinobacillus delphinicola]
MALLDIRNLCVDVITPTGKVKMIDNVTFSLNEGELCGLVGESGSGKSIIAKIICNEIQDNWIIRADRFRFDDVELLKLPAEERRSIIGRKIALVSQAALSTLDPTRRLGKQIKQNIPNWTFKGRWWQYFGWKRRRTIELLHRVGIQDHRDVMRSYPEEITEGQRQKVLIAMAVANQPRLLVADEPTNALEAITKTQIFRLLDSMNKNLNTTVLLASNDINHLKEYCDHLIILYCGQNVESGTTEALLSTPHHPYTPAIMHAMPDFSQPIPTKSRLGTLRGTVPMIDELPIGCRLGPRCPFSQKQCIAKPALTYIRQQEYACHFPLNMRAMRCKTKEEPAPLVIQATENSD